MSADSYATPPRSNTGEALARVQPSGWLVFRALAELLYVQVMLKANRFSRLARCARVEHTTANHRADVTLVCCAVGRACCYLPVNTPCLPRSLVALRLLRRRGVSAEMVLGVSPPPVQGHAWVEWVGEVVNDDCEKVARYAVVARF